eukprot:159704_1
MCSTYEIRSFIGQIKVPAEKIKLNRLLWYIFALNSLIQDLCQLFSIYSDIYYKTILWRFLFNFTVLWRFDNTISSNWIRCLTIISSVTPFSQLIILFVVLNCKIVPCNISDSKKLYMLCIFSNITGFLIHVTVIWKYLFIQISNPWFGYANREVFGKPYFYAYENTEQIYIVTYNITFIISIFCITFWIHQQLKLRVNDSSDISYEMHKPVIYLSVFTDFMYIPNYVFRSILIENNKSYFSYFCNFTDKYLLILIMSIIISSNYIGSFIKIYSSHFPKLSAAATNQMIIMHIFYIMFIIMTFIVENYMSIIVNSLLLSIVVIGFCTKLKKDPLSIKTNVSNFIYIASNNKDRLLRILSINLTYRFLHIKQNNEIYDKINRFGIYNMEYKYLTSDYS